MMQNDRQRALVVNLPVPNTYVQGPAIQVEGHLTTFSTSLELHIFVNGQQFAGGIQLFERTAQMVSRGGVMAKEIHADFLVEIPVEPLPAGLHQVECILVLPGGERESVVVPVILEKPERFLGRIKQPVDCPDVYGYVQIDAAIAVRAPTEIIMTVDGEPTHAALHWTPPHNFPAVPAGFQGFWVTASLFTTGWSPGRHAISFTTMCGDQRVVIATAYVRTHEIEVPLDDHVRLTVEEHRAGRLAKILAILECPACSGAIEEVDSQKIRCRQCSTTYDLVDGKPVMIVGKPEHSLDPSDQEKTSNHALGGFSWKGLNDVLVRDALALEIGAGAKRFGVDCLVQVEICNFPFADVIIQNERLPFQDATFDFIFALAVTEHVRDPWKLAREIERVAKPGALIHVDSAFLQPLHGYPSHYFNMTGDALRGLFPQVEVESLEVGNHQLPLYSLMFVLRGLKHSLSESNAKHFEQMTVREAIDELEAFATGQFSFFSADQIPLDARKTLAAGYTLIGKKAGATAPSNLIAAKS